MRRLTKTGSSKLNADSQRLVSLALEMFYASSFLESEFCRKKLEVLVFRLLQAKKQAVLNDAIEYLFTTDMEAYNCLLEVAEALSESAVIEEDGKKYQVLLVAVPVLAWTRFSIASGTLAPEQIEAISSRFARLILADDVRFAMAPGLYAVDQLPYSHVDVMAVTQGLVQSVVQIAQIFRQDRIVDISRIASDLSHDFLAQLIFGRRRQFSPCRIAETGNIRLRKRNRHLQAENSGQRNNKPFEKSFHTLIGAQVDHSVKVISYRYFANISHNIPLPATFFMPQKKPVENDKNQLTHFDTSGKAHMVDVGGKSETHRIAIACGTIRMKPETLAVVENHTADKGDVLGIARVAAIMGAKRTSDLIPLCHPVALTRVTVDFTIAENSILCQARTETVGKTGVEMEALTAVQTGLLTIYDMLKAIDRGMTITDVRLLEKSGGKTGTWNAENRN